MTQTCVSLAPPPWVWNSERWWTSQQPEESWMKGKAVWGNHQINKYLKCKKKKRKGRASGQWLSAKLNIGSLQARLRWLLGSDVHQTGNSRLPACCLAMFPLVPGSPPASCDPHLPTDTEKAPSYYFSWISPSSLLTLHVYFSQLKIISQTL